MFCGSDGPVTAEHIFGSALSKKFRDQRIVAVARTGVAPPRGLLSPEHEKPFYRSLGTNPLAITSHSMCKNCNGSLGEELTKLTHILENFFKGHTNIIPEVYVKAALRYFQRIAILVDLEVASFDSLTMTESENDIVTNQNHHVAPSLLSPEERLLFAQGAILPRISVYLGRHKGRHGKSYAMNVARYFIGPNGPAEMKFVFSIQKVSCMLCIGTEKLNTNPKLQLFERIDVPFRLKTSLVSDDFDVKRNHNMLTTHLDGTITIDHLSWDRS